MTSRIRSRFAICLWAFAGLVTAQAHAGSELDLRGDLGYDSNVFSLNDAVGRRDGLFTDLEGQFTAARKSPGGEIGLDLGAAARMYDSAASDGDEKKYWVRLRGDSGGKRSDHAFEWALRYRARDATFVSRFTGTQATEPTTGADIRDRFDSRVGDLRGGWYLPGGDYGRASVETGVASKDYRRDYAALGLDRLDYTHYDLTPAYEAGGGAAIFRIRLPVALRQYRDRRTRDAAGNSVAGTDLEYSYYGAESRYEHAVASSGAVHLTGAYEKRQDNGLGYGDRTRWNAGLGWVQRPFPGGRFATDLEWSSRVLERPATGDPLINDVTPDRRGYAVRIQFAAPLPGSAARDLSLFAEALWESYDNSSNTLFSYDRLESFLGVRGRF